jgi:hypothetical protein
MIKAEVEEIPSVRDVLDQIKDPTALLRPRISLVILARPGSHNVRVYIKKEPSDVDPLDRWLEGSQYRIEIWDAEVGVVQTQAS